MSNETTKENLEKKPERSSAEKELLRIKEGLNYASGRIIESLKQRVGTGDWKLFAMDFSMDGGKESIDMVFSAPDGKKEKYIIIDLSIPHLGVGQKYALPGKAKTFQNEREVTAARIKKAIILIRKGTESVSTQSSRIRCPIIDIQLESIVKPEPSPVAREKKSENRPNQTKKEPQETNRPQNPVEPEKPASSTGITGVSQELLFALKEAIVHECLSTMHKRCNKYIRKGLWRWIEREIMDPNVHFYLIILSSIYQGKTGEILSRRFKTAESYSSNPEEVINALFSKENNLADEIKKSSERHKKALNKFLACFCQTPPFEYLKSIFLKDFRSHADGLKARMTVYSTLMQLLERCGFEGEKETQYPLEILDELKVFQGIMTGNYSTLRTDNASKKLKHLVPQVEWTNEDIYQLRNQLAKALNLPSQEFNLNAFLPQAFMQDAKHMAETRKEAVRAPVNNSARNDRQPEKGQRDSGPENRHSSNSNRNQKFSKDRQPRYEAPESASENPNQADERPLPREEARRRHNEEIPPRKPRNSIQSVSENSTQDEEQAGSEKPINVENMLENQSLENDASFDRNRRRPGEIDEAKHRFFEYFGGVTEEDQDSVRLALAIDRYEAEAVLRAASKSPTVQIEEPEFDENHQMPVKRAASPHHVNSIPPRKPSINGNNGNMSNGANGNNRIDRKRRFNKNAGRNKTRRNPNIPGVNR